MIRINAAPPMVAPTTVAVNILGATGPIVVALVKATLGAVDAVATI